jgi:hypothetical protein
MPGATIYGSDQRKFQPNPDEKFSPSFLPVLPFRHPLEKTATLDDFKYKPYDAI